MACSEHQTSTILDCICINGETLIDYIDGGDQTLQALITAMQATLTTLQACCTSNTAAIETINGLIPLLQAELAALQTCCNTNTAAIATLQSLVATLQETVTTLQAQAHPALTLTKVQDVTNRATLDTLYQVLNLPPALVGRIWSATLAIPLTAGPITPITGLTLDFDTWSGLAPGVAMNSLIVPRTGRYNLTGAWGTGVTADPCPDFIAGVTIGVNQEWAGRFTSPNCPTLTEGAHAYIAAHLLQAGDVITLGAYTDCTGAMIGSAYLALEYIEGT